MWEDVSSGFLAAPLWAPIGMVLFAFTAVVMFVSPSLTRRRYTAKFGFPFILAVKGYDRAGILREFARRVERDRAAELAECVAQIARITWFRLEMLIEPG